MGGYLFKEKNGAALIKFAGLNYLIIFAIMETNKIYHSGCLEGLKQLEDNCIDCVVTSPPYYGLRAYGTNPVIWDGDENCRHEWSEKMHIDKRGTGSSTLKSQNKGLESKFNTLYSFCSKCGAWRGELGLEPTPELYVKHIVDIFREVKRVLKKEGNLWINLGDSYNGSGGAGSVKYAKEKHKQFGKEFNMGRYQPSRKVNNLKPKDLIGIPWLVAFALRADGWYLRQDIIWCLSGGTYVYAKTQKGAMPMMVRDAARLDPTTVKLWNGEKWTQVRGWSRSARKGDEIELVLRSGERISCTPTHKFPTSRGLLNTSDIQVGDILQSCNLPEPEIIKDCAIDEDAAWFAGLYIAEGSRSGDTIQFTGHVKEKKRWVEIQRIAAKFGGTSTITENGNTQNIRVYGKLLNAILDELVAGRIAKDKGLSPICWRYSNKFLKALTDGYLSGDGHWDEGNQRWRLGFTRNYNLERDLRTLSARLGFKLSLKLSNVKYNGEARPTFKGEIRWNDSNHHNAKEQTEVVEIRKARCRNVYDVGVEDKPHLFSLASGVLTHNSKRNPMPESVTDRCTKSHEYIFLLSKSAKYYFDADAIKTEVKDATMQQKTPDGWDTGKGSHGTIHRKGREKGFKGYEHRGKGDKKLTGHSGNFDSNGNLIGDGLANKRSVWTVNTQPFKEWGETSHWHHAESDAPFDGNLHIMSVNCPNYGGLFDLLAILLNDEHEGDLLSHILHTCNYLSVLPKDGYVPIENFHELMIGEQNLDCFLRSYLFSATPHNNESHKTDLYLSTSLSCKPSEERFYHIQHILTQRGLFVLNHDNGGNNILSDDFPCSQLPQTIYYIVGKLGLDAVSYGQRYEKITKKTSHFAVFPEKLIVDCIKAGCPEGGTVLDPFMGAGTTAVVARKLNRKYIGFELIAEYIKMAEKRLYNEMGLFL